MYDIYKNRIYVLYVSENKKSESKNMLTNENSIEMLNRNIKLRKRFRKWAKTWKIKKYVYGKRNLEGSTFK